MGIWVVSAFWLLLEILLWTLMYKFLHGHVFISLGICLVWNMGCMTTLCLTFWGAARLFSKVAASFYIATSSIVSPTLVIIYFIITILVVTKWYLTVVLICIFLLTSDTEHFFHIFISYLCIFFGEMSVHVFCLSFRLDCSPFSCCILCILDTRLL